VPDLIETPVSAAVIGQLIGVSARRVTQLRDEGIIPAGPRGKFILGQAVRAYCAHMRPASGGHAAGGAKGGPDPSDLAEQKARLTKAQADLAEMKLDAARGVLVPAADVDREWRNTFAAVRSRLLAVPSRLRQVMDAEAAREADVEIRAALNELGNGDG
jgi:terminase small subunit / prophage DNA-packing protein